MSPLGFNARVGSAFFRYFCRGKCNVHSPRFTSGATLANLLVASAQLVTSPHACAETGLGSDSNMQLHEQKTNAIPLCQRPGINLGENLENMSLDRMVDSLSAYFGKKFAPCMKKVEDLIKKVREEEFEKKQQPDLDKMKDQGGEPEPKDDDDEGS